MADISGIPGHVPQQYKDQLQSFQSQIKILLQNHQILLGRLEKNPEDKKVLEQIEQVKIYLISFSEQQKEVLDKVRQFLSDLEEEKNKTPEKETKSSRCSTPKSRGRPPNKSKAKGKSSKNSSEAASDSSEDEADGIYLAYLNYETGYKGHVEDYDISPGDFDKDDEPVEEFVKHFETTETLENINKEKFLASRDLLTEPNYNSTLSRIEELRRRKHFNVVTYIPDISDKKLRYQTFLQNTVTSPPRLRNRRSNQLPVLPPRASTRNIPAPEKMETRNKSLGMFRSQVDGTDDFMEDMEEDTLMESVRTKNIEEKIAFRNQLLKRKLEMEDELESLHKRARTVQERRERQKDEKMLLLKEQRETEQKIRDLLNFVADIASTYNSSSGSSSSCL